MCKKIAIIVGAGPAGLTAAYELLKRTDILPVILEKSNVVGGISRTVDYKGNKIDIGGHRFFSKSKRVTAWWENFLPHEDAPNNAQHPNNLIMLKRERHSRILYLRRFFDYPLRLNFKTVKNLGVIRLIAIFTSYAFVKISPRKNENTLEDFFINRFGIVLYRTFFKDYTEKVWGVPCNQITAEWGAQRIKGLSISKTMAHAISNFFNKGKTNAKVETSLINQFMYPKHGPGQLWEEVANQVQKLTGTIIFDQTVQSIEWLAENQVEVKSIDSNGKTAVYQGTFVFSTMPVKGLIKAMGAKIPNEISRIAEGLVYRDFITVGLLVDGKVFENLLGTMPKDNWIYIQENDVAIGRLQLFNNWSPYLVADSKHMWLGLEYFCNEGDGLWQKKDEDFIAFAVAELQKLKFVTREAVLDATIIREPKAYPAYFGTYNEFDKIRQYTDRFKNMYLIGRNGMHKYNNQDHSMLTAMVAVDNIINGIDDKNNLWTLNTEKSYHETQEEPK